MKLATIAPPQYAKHIAHAGYHMALGQHLMDDPTYLNVYRTVHRRGGFILVDNGAAEGDIRPFIDVVAVANEIGADEIAMPDVLRDGPATFEVASDPYALGLVPPHRRMMIPQGNSWEEWRECARSMVQTLDFATIGIPKHLERLEWGRGRALLILNELGVLSEYNIHLLGVWADAEAEVRRALSVYRNIRGIDTGAPIAYAQNGNPLHGARHYSLEWNDDGQADGMLIDANIHLMEHWCYAKFDRRRPDTGAQTSVSGVREVPATE